MPEDDLTPAERQAFAALEKMNEPSRLLEERTVRALKAQGLLRARRRVSPSWLVAAVAAGAVLYLGGLATGQWLANRQTRGIVSELQRDHTMEAAALVQRTGSAYAQAIASLARKFSPPSWPTPRISGEPARAPTTRCGSSRQMAAIA